MNKVKKRSLIVSLAILAVVVFALLAFLGLYFTRIQTCLLYTSPSPRD